VGEPAPDRKLFGGDEQRRLAAARELRVNPTREALDELNAALAREHVRWVRIALTEAIQACEAVDVPPAEDPPGPESEETADMHQAYADGRRDGLRQALHELTPLLGMARAAAEGELAQGSEVRAQLDRMRAVSGALRQLINASAVPERREFDLAALLMRFEQSPPVPCRDGVLGTRGQTPFFIKGDSDLLELAVQPLVTNALEAVMSVNESPPSGSVMVSWGAELESYWIAVIDSGPGPPAAADLFAVGATNKPGHFGFGLETTRTAMTSLAGSAAMEKNGRGGATVLLRWPTSS
jgi:signal transduction histidine kinase